MKTDKVYVAFDGMRPVAEGELGEVLHRVRAEQQQGAAMQPLFFELGTGRPVDFDLRGSVEEVLARITPPVRSGPGRPKLGVVAREISLLPRHWDWLEEQPNGASAALRRLVDEARKAEGDAGEARRRRDAACRIMMALCGNLPGFEEAMRALYQPDQAAFEERMAAWPEGLRDLLTRLASVDGRL